MNKPFNSHKIENYFKRAIQLISFLFLPGLFIQIFLSIKTVIRLLVQQQSTLQEAFPNILLLITTTVMTLFFGRFFCGFMCSFGSMSDFLYHIFRRKNTKKPNYFIKVDSTLKLIKYLLLGIIVIVVWTFQLTSIPLGINPCDFFGMLTSLRNISSLPELIKSSLPAAIILVLIMIASVFVERFFCRYLCPLGAYFSIISKLRKFRIVKKPENCGSCTLCTQKCSMGINLTSTDVVKNGACINCMACTLKCPRKNAHTELFGRHSSIYLSALLSCILITLSYYAGNLYETKFNQSSNNDNSSTNFSDVATGIAANLSDGVYTGNGTGFRGEITVSVEVSNELITNITIDSSQDDRSYINRASSYIINEIISTQSSDIDAVSGATYSSNGIIEAVNSALNNQISINDTNDSNETNEANDTNETSDTNNISKNTSLTVEDGTYEGVGTGFRGETHVTVEVSDGKISNITVNSYQDDEQFFDRAFATVIEEILDAQSTDVDAVSGATYSSNGILEAVADALNLEFTPNEIQQGHGHKNNSFHKN